MPNRGITPAAFLAFRGLALILALTPGPDGFLTLPLQPARTALYLVYLGVQAFLSHRRNGGADAATPARSGIRPRTFGAGLISNLTNPKVGLFSSPWCRSSSRTGHPRSG